MLERRNNYGGNKNLSRKDRINDLTLLAYLPANEFSIVRKKSQSEPSMEFGLSDRIVRNATIAFDPLSSLYVIS